MEHRTVPGTNRPIENYDDFFPYYLSEHSKPAVRGLHYAGTFAATTAFFGGLLTGTWWLVLLSTVFGYGPAWVSHFFIEKNKPATFDYPLWSLRGDYHMLWLKLTGRLKPALRAAGVED
ncbi:MAG: Mpo1-like protein [Alphaproteobacteria bacterium]